MDSSLERRQQQAGSGGWRNYVSISGASCVAGGLILHLFAAQQGKRVTQLKTVKDMGCIDDIAHLVLPAVVALRGRVASNTPKPCKLSRNQAVMLEILVEDVYRNGRNDHHDTLEVLHTFSHAEWHLDDGCHARVRVENAKDASGLQSVLETKQGLRRKRDSKTPKKPPPDNVM